MEGKKNPIAATSKYFREVAGELRKVVWPTWARTARLTGIVVGMVFLVAAFMALLDWPLGLGMQRFLGR